MSKYSMTATKKDYQYAFDELLKLEKQLKKNLDWKKIKRVSLDELSTLIGILKRKLPVQPQSKERWVLNDLNEIYQDYSLVVHIATVHTNPNKETASVNAERIVKGVNLLSIIEDKVKVYEQSAYLPQGMRESFAELKELLKQSEDK